MKIAKYTSLKEAILNMYRNTGESAEVNLEDMAYWAYEALELMGSQNIYIPKIIGHMNEPECEFDDWKVKLPCDFHKLRAISVNGYAAYPSTNLFHNLKGGGCCSFDSLRSGSDSFFDNFGNEFSPQALPFNVSNAAYQMVTFDISNNYITFNMQEGKACIAYDAFPVDEEGLPLIPDDVKIVNAVTKFLEERIAFKQTIKGLMDKDIYINLFQKERNWSMAQASNWLKQPSLGDLENYKNQALKMAVRKDEYASFFQNLNSSSKF